MKKKLIYSHEDFTCSGNTFYVTLMNDNIPIHKQTKVKHVANSCAEISQTHLVLTVFDLWKKLPAANLAALLSTEMRLQEILLQSLDRENLFKKLFIVFSHVNIPVSCYFLQD